MAFVEKWCVVNKLNIFYCRAYDSKKSAKHTLKVLKGHFVKGIENSEYFNMFRVEKRLVFL